MNPLITVAMKSAGELSRTTALNIRAAGYVINHGDGPDDRYTAWLLADALMSDVTGVSAINDTFTLRDRDGSTSSWLAADERRSHRWSLTQALTALTREDRIALIDALADGRNAVAA